MSHTITETREKIKDYVIYFSLNHSGGKDIASASIWKDGEFIERVDEYGCDYGVFLSKIRKKVLMMRR